jgi:hypothetical protein
MNTKINESYGTEIIPINDKFQLKLVEGYYYKPYLIKEPKKPINGILFRDYREYNSWEVVWSFSENKMDVGVLHNNRNEINYLIKQQIENNKTK